MNKTFVIAWLAAFIVWMGADFGVHAVWLAPDYLALAALYRPEAEQMQFLPWNIGSHVVMAAALVWIYARGVNAGPWMGQGVRYGLAVGCFMAPMYFVYYAVMPVTMKLAVSQAVGCVVSMVLVGIVTAFFYRGSTKAA